MVHGEKVIQKKGTYHFATYVPEACFQSVQLLFFFYLSVHHSLAFVHLSRTTLALPGQTIDIDNYASNFNLFIAAAYRI